MRRLSKDSNFLIIEHLSFDENRGTFMRAPNVVGWYPQYKRYTDLYRDRKENFTGLCEYLEHLEPVIFKSTEEQEEFHQLVIKLYNENTAFFTNINVDPQKLDHFTFPTGEFRRTDGVHVDPRTNTPITYNGYYYGDTFYPKRSTQPSKMDAPWFTGFHCRIHVDSVSQVHTLGYCGLGLLEEDDIVIPLCKYKETSKCYRRKNYAEKEDTFVDKKWTIGNRDFYGHQRQKNFSEAAAFCRRNAMNLLDFTLDKKENLERMKVADAYYKKVAATPSPSCVLTSGEMGPLENIHVVVDRDLTFKTNNVKYSYKGSPFFLNTYGFSFQTPFELAYRDVFSEEKQLDPDQDGKAYAAKKHDCAAYTHKIGLYPLPCSMPGYFMCYEGDYPWTIKNYTRNNTLDCECGVENGNGDSKIVDHPWSVLLYFRFRAFSREVPALDYKVCAGTLINNMMILTSGTCAYDYQIAQKVSFDPRATADKVVIALNTITQRSGGTDDKPKMITGTVVKVYPRFFGEFKKSFRDNVEMDWEKNIALIKIDDKHKLDFSDSTFKLRPACLADIGKQDLSALYGKMAKVTGWSGGGGAMRSYEAKFVNIEDCKKIAHLQTKKKYKITDDSLCHQVTDDVHHLKEHDEGAPMVVKHPENKWQVIGIGSSYSNVGGSKVLSLFTDLSISEYVSYINYYTSLEGGAWCKK